MVPVRLWCQGGGKWWEGSVAFMESQWLSLPSLVPRSCSGSGLMTRVVGLGSVTQPES